MSGRVERVHDPVTGLWAVRIVLAGGGEVTVVLDAVECERLIELTGGYGTDRLPASVVVMGAMLYTVTGRDVLAGLLPDRF